MQKQKFFISILIIILLAALGAAGYFYVQFSQLKKNPQATAEKEVAGLVAKVGKLIVLPADETPTVATVTDSEKLKDQAFFSQAQNGDKVLIYTKAKKAILYNPVTNKIIDVAPLNIGSSSGAKSTPAPAPVAPTPAKQP